MSFVKSFVAFVLGISALLFFYYKVSIPIIPSISVYLVGMLFNKEANSQLRKALVVLFGFLAIALYGINTFIMIQNYQQHGNVVAIVFGIIDIVAFWGATVMNFIANNQKDIKVEVETQTEESRMLR